jgi:two-component system, OmpR family, sensor histidine kinase KdpD
MPDVPSDPRWPKLLSLSVHEFRTPLTVVAGYIRMLLKERGGPLAEQQRKLLEEAEKSCGRLSALLAEVSDLANIEAGTAPVNRQRTDLVELLRGAVERLPPLPDREVPVQLEIAAQPASVDGDPTRLSLAFTSVILALRREIITADPLVVRQSKTRFNGADAYEVLVGDPQAVRALEGHRESDLPLFDEWRGGSGLSLPVARRVFNIHDGRIWGAPEERKSGARIVLPASKS